MNFENEKKMALQKLASFDKSKKGAVDSAVQPIITFLNSLPAYYTTSSCAGRILLIEQAADAKKFEANWLLCSHDPVSLDQVKSSLALGKDDVWLKQETAIFHVCCADLVAAQKLLDAAKLVGFKRSGMIVVQKRFILEILSQENMATLVGRGGEILVDDAYLQILVDEANAKLQKNSDRLKQFFDALQTLK